MTFPKFVELLTDRGLNPTSNGKSVSALCPAHADHNPSLSVKEADDGRILAYCHAGCNVRQICEALELEVKDLFPEPSTHEGASRIVATYPYTDERRNVLYEVVRYQPKAFRQRRPDPENPGQWIWSSKGIKRVLFRLPEILKNVKAGKTIFLCEGEKDVLDMEKHGFSATCNCGGAGKWDDSYTQTLQGAEVVIIADKDPTGRKHAAGIAASLQGAAKSVKVVECPDIQDKAIKDPADYFKAGGTADDLSAVVSAAPDWDAARAGASAVEVAENDDELVGQYGHAVFYKPGTTTVSSVNERFFAGRFCRSHHILFEPAESRFYDYDEETGLWKRSSDDAVREALSAHVLEYGRQNTLALESKITMARMGAMVQALKGICERRDAFTRHGNRIHVKNGVIRFDESNHFQLTKFQPEDYSRNCCPIEFIAEAQCPRFINELLEPALNQEDILLLQRWAGLAIAGVNPAQRFLILDGLPGTGKSTIANLMWKLVGSENCAQLRTKLLFERFELSRFAGKTMLMAPDVPGNFLNHPSASMLKSLVGGDQLTAESKGSNEVLTLEGGFNILVTANTRLQVRLDGDAGAWSRRILIIRFAGSPASKRIANFDDALLKEEGPGILRWALAGFLAAKEEIAQHGDFQLTEDQRSLVQNLLSESDSLRLFVTQCIEEGNDDLTSGEVAEAYYRFCAEYHWTPQQARTVERGLKELMLECHGKSQSHDIKGSRGWRGIELKALATSTEDVQHTLAYGRN